MNYPKKFKNEDLEKKWTELIKIRNICNISIEEKRANKEIGSSLEAEISIQLNNNYKKIVTSVDLSELCITSKAEIIYDNNVDIVVNTKKALGNKCPLCWKINKNPCSRYNCPKNDK